MIVRNEGVLNHFASYGVFRLVELYGYAPCTCGFNHDLSHLPGRMAEKINPKFYEECRKQDCGNEPPPTEAEITERKRFLEKLFGFPSVREPADDEREWNLIATVFGNEYVAYLKGK